ncbi:MAG: tRNA (adenosine(37)-N6)-dimethylallyltransferase MiaA, partial [Eubacteriales bacterium]|nr:tRNA (adenosine(37)-N6)-dimethylallyltransferase MiaA [Eubacteriales bacterium]
FQKTAFSLIDSLCENNIVPVVAGGTGLYINALGYKLDFYNFSKNDIVRQKYYDLADDKGVQCLYNILNDRDPEYAKKISSHDKRRIIRRLEILDSGGRRPYNFRQYNDDYDVIMIGLTLPREVLYKRINERVDDMLAAGLLDEVQRLYDEYGNVNALKAIGYKELIGYINGEYGLNEAVRLIKQNTRRFAKRQMTWFARDPRIVWFDISAYSCIEDTINDIIKCIKRKGF